MPDPREMLTSRIRVIISDRHWLLRGWLGDRVANGALAVWYPVYCVRAFGVCNAGADQGSA